jgi:hypothetical protein
MKVKEIIRELDKDSDFKKWREEDSVSYLAHIFLMVDENQKENLQVGYYNRQKDNMIVFIRNDDHFEKSQEMGVFKKPEADIQELDLGRIALDFDEANSISKKLKQEKYSSESLQREIQILQMLGGRPVFNNTFITQSFKILNIKVDAVTKEIQSHMLKSIMDLGKIEK